MKVIDSLLVVLKQMKTTENSFSQVYMPKEMVMEQFNDRFQTSFIFVILYMLMRHRSKRIWIWKITGDTLTEMFSFLCM